MCKVKCSFVSDPQVHLDDDVVEVLLTLPWRPAIQIEYSIRGQWPITQGTARCGISIQGPYEFLHDVTCKKIQDLCSRYRQVGFTFLLKLFRFNFKRFTRSWLCNLIGPR